MRRVYIMGTSGSGKSTLGRELARRLAADFIEIDSIYHQSGWTPLPLAEFRAQMTKRCAAPAWVVDGNYSAVRDIALASADTIVFLDYPRSLVMGRLARRTLRRWVTQEELWNGNRERARDWFSRDRERNLLLWAWTTHARRHQQCVELERDPAYAHTERLRFTTPQQTAAWLASL